MPFFSVIIPIYKVEPYLRECIDSVLAQSFTDYEMILVDDGSPDGCPAICDEYAETHSNIEVIHQQNQGLSEARNAGLRQAKGQYVAFLDSDDTYCRPELLQKAHELLLRCGVDTDMVFHQRRYYDDTTKEFLSALPHYSAEVLNADSTERQLYLLSKSGELEASACVKFIRRDFLMEHKSFFKRGILSEDVEWFFRLFPYIKKTALLSEGNGGYAYRRREGSISKSISHQHVMDMLDIVCANAECWVGRLPETLADAAMLNYLAYQYYITIGLIHAYADRAHVAALNEKMKSYRWLSRYCISRKTKLAAFVMRIPLIGGWILGKRALSRAQG